MPRRSAARSAASRLCLGGAALLLGAAAPEPGGAAPRLAQALSGAYPWLVVTLAAVVMAVAGFGVACLLLRRLCLGPVQAALAALDHQGARLAAAAREAGDVQTILAEAAAQARDSAADAAVAVRVLDSAQSRLLSRLDSSGDADRIAALADQCEQVTGIMPGLLAKAVDAMQEQGMARLSAIGASLQESSAGIAGAVRALQAAAAAPPPAALAETSAAEAVILSRLDDMPARIAAMLTAWRDPATEADAAAPAREADSGARIAGAVTVLEACVASLAHAAAQHAGAQAGAAAWAATCDRVAQDAAALPERLAAACLRAIEIGAARAGAAQAGVAEEAAEMLRRAAAALHEARASQDHGAASLAALDAAMRGMSEQVARHLAQLSQDPQALKDAGLALAAQHEAAPDASAAAALHGQASAWMAEAPELSRQIAAAAGEMRAQCGAMTAEITAAAGAVRNLAGEGASSLAARVDRALAPAAQLAAELRAILDLAQRAQAAGPSADIANSVADSAMPQAAARLAAIAEHLPPLLAQLAGAASRLDAVAVPERWASLAPAPGDAAPRIEEPALRLTVQVDRLSDLLSAWQDAVCRFSLAAPPPLAAEPAGLPAAASLQARIEDITALIARLIRHAEAQDSAAARVTASADALAEAALAAHPAAPDSLPGTLLRAAQAVYELHAMARRIAEAATRGTGTLPEGLAANTPMLLAEIAAGIQHLQGTATALALASDTLRDAA